VVRHCDGLVDETDGADEDALAVGLAYGLFAGEQFRQLGVEILFAEIIFFEHALHVGIALAQEGGFPPQDGSASNCLADSNPPGGQECPPSLHSPSARNRLPAFRFLDLAHVVERFGQLDNVGVLGIHLKKIDQV
jgi:hypothetical protein